MGKGSFRVLQYSHENLIALLAEDSDKSVILGKTHSIYFEGYFNRLQAKAIVVECEYIDHDYLEDYTAYYVRCFHNYRRTTRRIHFFSIELSEEDLTSILKGKRPDLIKRLQDKDSYLGFIVVKPLPQTIVGRTCLRTYPDDNGRRHYPIIQKYSANLFGIKLDVCSLAFQEQDSVVAACATSALWSVFQGTGHLFHHRIPSPAEITRVAAHLIPEEHSTSLPETRGMPNKGLTAAQMAHAIRDVGLEPYLVGATNKQILKSTIYAYLKAKIPIILVFGLVEIDQNIPQGKVIGRHGVAITGFSIGQVEPIPIEGTNINIKALKIDKIYAHDDQVGPYARMGFLPDGHLDTSWGSEQGKNIIADPHFLLIPLYHKIRIPFGSIQDAVSFIGQILDTAITHANLADKLILEWDIYLTTVNDLKSEILESNTTIATQKDHVLTHHLPKYMWRVSLSLNDSHEIDLLFDATDIEQGGAFLYAIEHGSTISTLLTQLVKQHPVLLKTPPLVASLFQYFNK